MRMGQSMGKGISQITTRKYTGLVKKVFPVRGHIALQDDLGKNPVIQHAVSIIAAEAYHKFGLALAPLSVMVSADHLQVKRVR